MSRRAHPGHELKDQGFRSADLCRAVAASWICELKRTSLTHPLQIAAVAAGAGFGRMGITLCPDKCDRHAMSGEWERDLASDLDAGSRLGRDCGRHACRAQGAHAAESGTSRR